MSEKDRTGLSFFDKTRQTEISTKLGQTIEVGADSQILN